MLFKFRYSRSRGEPGASSAAAAAVVSCCSRAGAAPPPVPALAGAARPARLPRHARRHAHEVATSHLILGLYWGLHFMLKLWGVCDLTWKVWGVNDLTWSLCVVSSTSQEDWDILDLIWIPHEGWPHIGSAKGQGYVFAGSKFDITSLF